MDGPFPAGLKEIKRLHGKKIWTQIWKFIKIIKFLKYWMLIITSEIEERISLLRAPLAFAKAIKKDKYASRILWSSENFLAWNVFYKHVFMVVITRPSRPYKLLAMMNDVVWFTGLQHKFCVDILTIKETKWCTGSLELI